MITIIDYKTGNLGSIQNILKRIGEDSVVTSDKDEIAGEILINSIDRDGVMEGYDIELIKSISGTIKIPIIACGGAGRLSDFSLAVNQGGASAVAAGSFFVFHGKRRAVLITYPSYSEISGLFC